MKKLILFVLVALSFGITKTSAISQVVSRPSSVRRAPVVPPHVPVAPRSGSENDAEKTEDKKDYDGENNFMFNVVSFFIILVIAGIVYVIMCKITDYFAY